ncbi:flagellar hook-length control protein FliK [Cupriavidus lacunae]|uniref:Flagellar hook-length control protein FliK n=1 Tax=Cupriavidus lacunae TaxID=2666307 RepID=A0A370NN50_9BURK|nr:flagellar hook-length control protein FliK [Cupriavidus lacunae]RDK07036.1 flagellar hook-length control protein FliK [Cupriavidus lacunae]
MIDISQIVSSAANAAEGARRATAEAPASGFGDALSRARDSNKAAAPAPAARETAARDQPASRPAAAQADAAKPQQAATTAKKPAGKKDEDQEDTAAATPTDAATAAAAAALALMLPATAPASPASPAATPAGAAGTAVAGVTDSGGAAALQAALATATQTTATDAQAETSPAAAALPPDTLHVATTEARPAQPSVADTLATIASQRATMQAGATAGTDGKAGATQAVAGHMLAARPQDTSGQNAGGSDNRPDSGIGQHRADPLAASTGAPDAKPAATPFAAAQAAAHTSETAAASPDNTQAIAATLAGQPTPTAAAAAAAAASRPVVAPPLYDSQWPQALGQQMIRLGTQGQQSAELQLNPPNLGPLKVVLNVVNDQAQAQFVSPHQAVRAAVEAALPHLRTALSENGIQLGQTSVGADGFAGQAGNGNGQQQQAPGNGRGQFTFGAGTLVSAEPAPAASAAARPTRVLGRGEIDTFA